MGMGRRTGTGTGRDRDGRETGTGEPNFDCVEIVSTAVEIGKKKYPYEHLV